MKQIREMTTAEFAKANLANVEEPIRIRRYTKAIGMYYPAGYEPPTALIDMGPDLTPEKVEALRMELDIPGPTAAARITELEAEVAHLKRELAVKLPVPDAWQPKAAAVAGLEELQTQERRTIRPKRDDDPFSGLAKQDREFFDRKLGGKAKR